MTGSRPLVSICVPTYNRATLLGQSLGTIVKQDYAPLEIVISDNCSDDGTEALCREIAAQDGRVRYVRQARNLGLYGNHNYCIEAARGEFLCFFHDDDVYDSRIIGRYVGFMEENRTVGVVCADWEIVDEDGVSLGVRDHAVPRVCPGLQYIARTLRSGRSSIGCPGAMIRRRALDGIRFDEDGPIGFSDFVVWFRIAERWDIGHVPERLWRYRLHRRSLSRRTVASMADDYRRSMLGYCDDHLRRWPGEARRVARWRRLVDRYLFWALSYELALSCRPATREKIGRRHRTVFEIADYRLSPEEAMRVREWTGRLSRGPMQFSARLVLEAMLRLGLTGQLAWFARHSESARRILGLR